MAKDHIQIDLVLNALGPLGFYPLCQCCIYFFSYFVDAYQIFSYVFTGQEVTHRCAAPNNDSISLIPDLLLSVGQNGSVHAHYGSCGIEVSTNVSGEVTVQRYPCLYGFDYDTPKDRSLVSEFDLVCEHEYLAAVTLSLNLFGGGLGSLVLPGLSDRFGRKRMMSVNNILVAIASTVAAVAPTYLTFALARFFSGLFCAGIGMTAVTAGVELFPTKHRVVTSGFWSTLFWALCIMSLSPIAYGLRFLTWRATQVAATLSTAVVFIQYVLLDEPLRWLYANGKTKEIYRVLKKAARWNRKDFRQVVDVLHSLDDTPHRRELHGEEKPADDVKEVELQRVDNHVSWEEGRLSDGKVLHDPEEEGLQEVKAVKKVTVRDMFTHRRLRVNSFLSCMLMCFNGMTYFGLYLMSSMLAGGLYLNMFLNAAVEGASCILIMGLMDRLGRRKTMALFEISAGVALIASSVCFSYEDSNVLQICGTALSLIGKLAIGGSFNSLFMYTPEYFPTTIRNLALGITMLAATTGSVIAPFTTALTKYAVWVPGVMFGGLNLLGAVALRFLPETMGRELPQTLADLDAMYDGPVQKETKEKNNALLPNS